jgi:maltose/moltooligosaccharide transporter
MEQSPRRRVRDREGRRGPAARPLHSPGAVTRRDDGWWSSRFQRYALTSGEMGSAGGQTLIAVLLPVLLAPHAPSTIWIGIVIASEGAFGLVLPYVAGAVSDSAPRRFGGAFGRRGRLLVAAAPAMALGLLLIALVDGFWPLAGAAVIYFAALHLYSGPLRALLIDATPEEEWGEVQGVMGATHVGGVAFGLVGGGLLYSIWEPLPFLVAAGLVISLTVVTIASARRLGQTHDAPEDDTGGGSDGGGEEGRGRDGSGGGLHGGAYGFKQELRFWRELFGRPDTRRFLLGNALWNAGVEGIRPYIFLFATVALGITVATASLAMIGFMVAAAGGSVLVGYFGDRYGRQRILILGAVVAGIAMMPGLFVRDVASLVLLLVPAGLGAAALISLPYPVFEGMVAEQDVGRSTGAYYMSVGVARVLAPLLVGAAIDMARRWMPETEGYPIMWPVAGTLILLGALALHLAHRAEEDRS